jgi:hypothetical protein
MEIDPINKSELPAFIRNLTRALEDLGAAKQGQPTS